MEQGSSRCAGRLEGGCRGPSPPGLCCRPLNAQQTGRGCGRGAVRGADVGAGFPIWVSTQRPAPGPALWVSSGFTLRTVKTSDF